MERPCECCSFVVERFRYAKFSTSALVDVSLFAVCCLPQRSMWHAIPAAPGTPCCRSRTDCFSSSARRAGLESLSPPSRLVSRPSQGREPPSGLRRLRGLFLGCRVGRGWVGCGGCVGLVLYYNYDIAVLSRAMWWCGCWWCHEVWKCLHVEWDEVCDAWWCILGWVLLFMDEQ